MNDYAKGGYISSPGDDSIPFVIHAGELWVSADMARRYGTELLRKLNGGGEVHVIDEETEE
jgi:hypothetical protein